MNSTNEIKVGAIGIVKVGCNEINVEVIQILNSGLLVKNLSTGKSFRAAKLERLLDENAKTALSTVATENGLGNPPEMDDGSEPESRSDNEPNDGDDGNGGETENTGDDIPAGDEDPDDDEQDADPDDDEQENPAPEVCRGSMVPASAPKSTAPAKPPIKKASTLDEAVKLLRESGEAKSCPELILELSELGVCSLKGATPAQTLYSSFIREIKDRGSKSRIMRDPKLKGKFKATPVEGGQNA